ncbi:hypothetical protein PBY51_004671 [Eleginops maclovinus]|uniref:Uncharacterized protein n=1 Tax=Eleginops maclovinus TaxID=56733 RepID=A0AAN7X4K7_ELEMC|nr:hypothetical protein PBY51_004671 [Eleginops maclovinus]
MSDYPPNLHACSLEVSGNVLTTIAAQPRSQAGPGLTGVEEEGEQRSLKQCAYSLTPEFARQQLHYTDDSRIFTDETLRIATPRAIVIQSPGSAQPSDLKPTNSVLPVNTLRWSRKAWANQELAQNRSRGRSTESRRIKSSN